MQLEQKAQIPLWPHSTKKEEPALQLKHNSCKPSNYTFKFRLLPFLHGVLHCLSNPSQTFHRDGFPQFGQYCWIPILRLTLRFAVPRRTLVSMFWNESWIADWAALVQAPGQKSQALSNFKATMKDAFGVSIRKGKSPKTP